MRVAVHRRQLQRLIALLPDQFQVFHRLVRQLDGSSLDLLTGVLHFGKSRPAHQGLPALEIVALLNGDDKHRRFQALPPEKLQLPDSLCDLLHPAQIEKIAGHPGRCTIRRRCRFDIDDGPRSIAGYVQGEIHVFVRCAAGINGKKRQGFLPTKGLRIGLDHPQAVRHDIACTIEHPDIAEIGPAHGAIDLGRQRQHVHRPGPFDLQGIAGSKIIGCRFGGKNSRRGQ
ncbi:MAG: hypothetical protein ACD_75C00836G0002 [uncultured bacterium]|nr:MAG: hypothetical protein ACD_75C00836G0002 [uncultured bacterium]